MAKYIYEVELKSKAFLGKEQQSLITYFKYPAKRELIASNMKKLYPQFTKKEDEPIINIRRIKTKEYHERVKGKKIELRKDIVSAEL